MRIINKKLSLKIFLILYILAVFSIYIVNLFYNFIRPTSWFLWIDSVYLISAVSPIVAGVYALRKFGAKSIHGRTLLFILLGMALFFAGEFTWMIYDVFLGEKPFPSIADLFYSAAYPLLLWGIILGLKIGKISWTKKRILISSFFLVIFTAITLYVGVTVSYNSQGTTLEKVLAVGYIIADIFVVAGIVLLVNLFFEFSGGVFSTTWLLLAIGILGRWASDILFAYFYEPYSGGALGGTAAYRIIDFGWIANYLLTSIMFLKQTNAIDNLKFKLMERIKVKKLIK